MVRYGISYEIFIKFGTFVNKISMAIGMRIHTKSAGHIFSSFFGFVK